MEQQFLVFFQSQRCNLDEVASALTKSGWGWKVKREDGGLIVTEESLGEGCEFQICHEIEAGVGSDAEQLGADTDFSTELSKCDACFVVVVTDFEAAIDEINSMMTLQGELQDLSGGYVYLAWNGTISPPMPD